MRESGGKIAVDDANFRRERSTMSRSVTRQDSTHRHSHRKQRSESPQKRERPSRPKDGSTNEDLWTPAAAGASATIPGQSPQQLRSGPRRLASAVEKERQDKIDRENRSASIIMSCLCDETEFGEFSFYRILLRKILEQHHGIRRHSDIPASGRLTRSNSATRPSTLAPPSTVGPRTSNQVRNFKKMVGNADPCSIWPCGNSRNLGYTLFIIPVQPY